MAESNKRLEELTKRRDQITAQIQALKAREQAEERKRDTRRKILIGAAVLERVKSGKWPEERLLAMMDEFLTKELDRQLFALPSKPAADKPATESNG
jgi:hypothetical protein